MSDAVTTTLDAGAQYDRACSLIVSDSNFQGLDLSALRIRFSVKRSDTMTPNIADIRVFNLNPETADLVKHVFNRHVILQAGYPGTVGVIFQGNIKQVIKGRESGTDTFIDIVAGDGQRAYNFAIVNTTIAKNGTQTDQLNAIAKVTSNYGVTAGQVDAVGQTTAKLPRGKVMYGSAKDYLRAIGQTTSTWWSIQNEKITFVGTKAYLPGTAVKITASSGMIGTPQQTNDGVNVKTLLNPNIKIASRVQLDNDTIAQQKLNLEQIAAAHGDVHAINNLMPRRLNAAGMYYVLVMEHTGDTRGIEWYTSLVCLNIDVSTNPRNAVGPAK